MSPPSPVDVRFVRGDDGLAPAHPFILSAGLTRRFAVVQDTHMPGWPDMWFEEPLWRALMEFVAAEPGAERLTAVQGLGRRRIGHLALGDFMAAWATTPEEDRAPASVVAWRGEAPLLALVPEYWCSVGGPDRYHDSYTYGLWTGRDLEDEVIAWLAARPEAGRWRVSPEVLDPDPRLRPGPIRRFLSWLR